MRKRRFTTAGAAYWTLAVLLASENVRADMADGRPWTIQDSISVRYLVTDQSAPAVWQAPRTENPIVPSPRGRRVFFVTYRGDLSCDCLVYQLHVYDVRVLKAALSDSQLQRYGPPQPIRTLTIRSRSPTPLRGGVALAHWEDDETIVFKSVQDESPRQVYRLNTTSGAMKRLSDARHDVFFFVPQGDSIIYSAYGPKRANVLDHYPVVEVVGSELQELSPIEDRLYTAFVSYRGGEARPIGSWASWLPGSAMPQISPDGRWAVMAFGSEDLPPPQIWSQYEGAESSSQKLPQFMLVDMERGSSKPMLEAPTGVFMRGRSKEHGRSWAALSPSVLWSSDSSHVVLVNTALPLSEEKDDRRRMSYLIDFDVKTGRWVQLEQMATPSADRAGASGRKVSHVGWLKEGQEFLVRHATLENEPVEGTVYTLTGNRWIGRAVPATATLPKSLPGTLSDGVSVTMRESANEPQVVIASDGKRELALTEPDPALAGIWRARMEPVQWRESDGRTVTGGLMLPRGSSKEHPVPLVVQASFYAPKLFRPDGTAPNTYAAQPLVGRGMAVLQIDLPAIDRKNIAETPREGPAFVERIDAAVDTLVRQGLVDGERVGLIGFSRGGYMTYYAVTHPGRTKLAAAVDGDGFTASYATYVAMTAMYGINDIRTRDYQGPNGGAFWQNKMKWLDEVPEFNVDRVRTPFLFAVHGQSKNVLALPTIGAFRLNNRPFEYLSFPTGDHQLVQPRERFASLEASVDWMEFWLSGRENPNPERIERNARWRRMRAQMQAGH